MRRKGGFVCSLSSLALLAGLASASLSLAAEMTVDQVRTLLFQLGLVTLNAMSSLVQFQLRLQRIQILPFE